ncbi:MAG: beta-ketoacyl synthase N-terminal-like domain-containing protein, partial [Leisingera sp.]
MTMQDGRAAAGGAAGDIAIVGLSVTVPGAGSAETFWQNLRGGIESIEVLDRDTLL